MADVSVADGGHHGNAWPSGYTAAAEAELSDVDLKKTVDGTQLYDDRSPAEVQQLASYKPSDTEDTTVLPLTDENPEEGVYL